MAFGEGAFRACQGSGTDFHDMRVMAPFALEDRHIDNHGWFVEKWFAGCNACPAVFEAFS